MQVLTSTIGGKTALFSSTFNSVQAKLKLLVVLTVYTLNQQEMKVIVIYQFLGIYEGTVEGGIMHSLKGVHYPTLDRYYIARMH